MYCIFLRCKALVWRVTLKICTTVKMFGAKCTVLFLAGLSNKSLTVLDVSCIWVLYVDCKAISKYCLCVAVKFSPWLLLAF